MPTIQRATAIRSVAPALSQLWNEPIKHRCQHQDSTGANIKTIASILGHSGLTYTEKYTRAVDSLKQAAINSMPPLNI